MGLFQCTIAPVKVWPGMMYMLCSLPYTHVSGGQRNTAREEPRGSTPGTIGITVKVRVKYMYNHGGALGLYSQYDQNTIKVHFKVLSK